MGDDSKEHFLFEKGRAMFGDVFGDRGDYTKGTFYASRRTFLQGKEDMVASSSSGSTVLSAASKEIHDPLEHKLKAPDFLLTRKQVSSERKL